MLRKLFLAGLVLAVAASCSGGKKKGLLLLPLSLGQATGETTAAGTATVEDTSTQAAGQTGGNDAALLGVLTGDNDASTLAGNNGSSSSGSSSNSGSSSGDNSSNGSSSSNSSSSSGSDSGSSASNGSSSGSNSGSSSSAGSSSGSNSSSNASSGSNGSSNGGSSSGSNSGSNSGSSGSSSGSDWPGETADEAPTADDPYVPVSELCQAQPAYHKQKKEKSHGHDDDDHGKGKSDDDNHGSNKGKGKGDDNDDGRGHDDDDHGRKESADMGSYDLSMDAANCLTGRFRIAVDFNVTGTVPKGSSFHVKIKDLLGRQIGFINLKADKAGVIPAKGKITLSEPNQTIFFVWEGGSDGRDDKAETVAANLEITGITLTAKRSQMSSGLAGFFGQSAQNRALIWTILGGMGGLLVLATIRLMRKNQTV